MTEAESEAVEATNWQMAWMRIPMLETVVEMLEMIQEVDCPSSLPLRFLERPLIEMVAVASIAVAACTV